VGEQVDGVLHSACAFQRAGVDGHPQGLRQLLPVELAGGPRQLDGALQEAPVHVVRDEPLAKRLQRALGKGRLGLAKATQHHVPARVEDRRLNCVEVRHPEVALEHQPHGEQRWRHGLLAGAGVSVHRLQLRLEGVVEDLVPVPAQEGEELPPLLQPLQDELLLPRHRRARPPPHHRHLRAS
jgi:hypothetical protein